ncbi:EscU/YscU/HrcU family type III secretion system export apparatus switch protein [Legionella jamestowniensis]|uniref:Flagellar biosynthetic protein FlhB n=1 Tax=Legionella jamestowniensis TaxID=455 RepID=A0A0W0UHN4_9GAMM|nr:EscU/YscU/HrcU family type III secretion system export apparatus switch protein [Legionella jamestowniensis]KTD07354.1 flagellar protein FlhB [Legionella jamestowniensis]OCH97870.1 flagellar biosynthesis protein FlhB [Legionella jamestowniensis]SFL94181.1 flagellar biosynthesis protein [Legionella jamestowniensis DSM 19215]
MSKDKTKAVALHYDGKSAPKVTAKGEGFIAEQIIKVAKEHGIPLQQNEQLTELLAQVELNKEIPRSLYVAVAQLLTFLYYINEKKPQDYQ